MLVKFNNFDNLKFIKVEFFINRAYSSSRINTNVKIFANVELLNRLLNYNFLSIKQSFSVLPSYYNSENFVKIKFLWFFT